MRKGFTLIELSIVLVIIGLLVGGILAGQSLIRTAALRSVATDSARNLSALYAFKDKYDALPGDMKDATRYWGAAEPDPYDCSVIQSATILPGTCDGDGSGYISDGNTPGDNRDQWYESYRGWQQLALAGLIEGSYVGNSIDVWRDQHHMFPGVNSPASKIGKGAGWTLRSFVAPYGSDWFDMPACNYITLGNIDITGEGLGAVLKPEEAWSIDKKLDDGKPGLGSIRAFRSGLNPGCTLSNADDTDYDLGNTDIACGFNFILKVKN